jgi:EmrB/QacA subfamily drug resistance transporter
MILSGSPFRASSRGTFVALLVAVLSFSLLQTMVVPALPDLQRQFGTSPSVISWVLSSFLLTSSVGTVLLGRLGDMFGRRRLLLVSLAILGAGTLVCALAESVGVLIAGRAVQGLGAATFPLAFGIVRDVFARERVPVVIGTISAMFGIGFGVGLIIPGPIVDGLGWRWIFWVSLVVILIAVAAVVAFIGESVVSKPGRVDWAGGALLSIGLAALLLAISQSRSRGVEAAVGLSAVAVVALAAFAVVQRRVRHPLIDLAVLRRRPVAAANATALIIGFGMYGAFTLVPQFVQTPRSAGYGFGASVTGAGLFLLPMAVTMLFAGPVAGRIGPRLGFHATLVLACAVNAVGFVLFAVGHDAAWCIAVGAGVVGIGIGFAFSSLTNVVIAAVEPRQTGEATGVNTIVRTLGGSIGSQVSAAIVTANLVAGTTTPAESGYTTAFVVSAVAMVVAGLAALATVGRRHTESATAAEHAHA